MSLVRLIEMVRDSADPHITMELVVKGGTVHWKIDHQTRKNGRLTQLIPYKSTGKDRQWEDSDLDHEAQQIIETLAQNALSAAAGLHWVEDK